VTRVSITEVPPEVLRAAEPADIVQGVQQAVVPAMGGELIDSKARGLRRAARATGAFIHFSDTSPTAYSSGRPALKKVGGSKSTLGRAIEGWLRPQR